MRKAITPAIVALVLILALAIGVNAQAVATNFTWVVTKLLTVTDTATFTSGVNVAGAMTAAGGLNVTSGGLNVTGGTSSTTLSVSSDTALGADLAISPQTAISVTNSGIITPTGTIQLLESAGWVTATLASGQSGQLLTLINTSNTNIAILDTTGQVFSGDVTLAQWDTADFVFYGTSWIQTGESNN